MEFAIWIAHVLVAAALVGLVLLQHGKGADMGAAFGSGASGSLFGASGSSNFLSRTTAVLAALFFLTSMSLTYFAGRSHGPVVVKPVTVPTQSALPVMPTESTKVVAPKMTEPMSAVPATAGSKVEPKAAEPKKAVLPAVPTGSSDKSGEIPK
jgi:preprotein translocase subunit SecG